MGKLYISKYKLISSIIFNGGNTFIFIILLKALLLNPGILKYLTYLSYCANSIFLFICLLCDIFIYFNNDNDPSELNNDYYLIEEGDVKKDIPWFEKLNNWNRNKYNLICNPFSFFVTFSFWILYFLGESYIKVSAGLYPMVRTVYLHLIITILITIDIVISKRILISNNYKDSSTILNLFMIYCIFIVIMKYYFNIMPYAFLKSSLLFLLCYMILSFILLFICFELNVSLVNYFNSKNNFLIEN